MGRKRIRLVIVLAVIAISGIIPVQIYWVKKAFFMAEKQFEMDVHAALSNVAEKIFLYNKTPPPLRNPVCQFSNNYYIVQMQEMLSPEILEHYLSVEFEKRNIAIDFKYGIYDCISEKMVYGNSVENRLEANAGLIGGYFPKLKEDFYYFGISFPSKTADLMYRMQIWTYSSFMLLLVVVFFGYTLFILLKQRRLSEVQKDFINNMTHELKTPLSTIAASSEVLKKMAKNENQIRAFNYASIVHLEAAKLTHQIEHILQVAASEKEDLKLSMRPTDVHRVIEEVVHRMDSVILSKEGQVNLHLKAERTTIEADIDHLENILYNLIDNAIKYSKEAPEIVIETYNQKSNLVIAIKDNGIGIDKVSHNRIFTKFYRVPTGNVHDVKGFGLGLHYVKTLVTEQRGRITVQSELGKGTTFILTFRIYERE